MSNIYLISDTREKHLHKLINDIFEPKQIKHVISQINTGDYLICDGIGDECNILACIERKTLKDYAASFKDGRYRNTDKMINLRNKTGCQLYYFVEGNVFLKPHYKIAGIPYQNIINSINHQMIRDNIHTVRTKDELGTATRLLEFIESFVKIDVPFLHPIDTTGGGGKSEPVLKLVNGIIPKDDITIATDMWASLAYISPATGRCIIDIYSFSDLFKPDVDITILKTPSGRKITKKGIASIKSLIGGCKKAAIRILTGIPGISKTVAAQIVNVHSLPNIIENNSLLIDFKIQQKNREVNLGDIKINRILKFLTFKNYISQDNP